MSNRSSGTVVRIGMLVLICVALMTLSAAAVVVINEVAWGGTAASASDEWLELYNHGESPADLTGWTLVFGETVVHLGEVSGGTVEVRRTVIDPGGYFLLERSDDGTISDIVADLIYRGSLTNAGVDVLLYDSGGHLVDQAGGGEDGWSGGTGADGTPPYASMERGDPAADVPTWGSNNGAIRNGLDADGEPINGTPAAENSATILAASTPRVILIWPSDTTEPISGVFVVTWSATDPDGSADALRVAIAVSADDGEQWEPLVDNLANAGSYAWDTTAYPNGDGYRLRLVVTDADGNSAEAVSGALSLANSD
jgi:hypothetical protein